MLSEKDEIILAHYKSVAADYGDSPQSTMEDETVRERETRQILDFLGALTPSPHDRLKILDLGCGNGYALSVLSNSYPDHLYYGTDFSEELLAIATERELAGCDFRRADARDLPFESDFFDAVYTERCLINILDWEQQQRALREIARVLKPGGKYLMIECFTDGLDNNNKARTECGLDEITAAYHNRYFEKELLFETMTDWFIRADCEKSAANQSDCPAPNFLSSHYFVARVLHPLVSKGTAVKNTEFVKFFSFLPPVGNYSPIQAFVFTKSSSE